MVSRHLGNVQEVVRGSLEHRERGGVEQLILVVYIYVTRTFDVNYIYIDRDIYVCRGTG